MLKSKYYNICTCIYRYVCIYAISKDMSRTTEFRVKNQKECGKKIQYRYILVLYTLCTRTVADDYFYLNITMK